MKRDLKRVYKRHGIKYFAFPVIILLVFSALADQWLGNYLTNREEAADLEIRLENNRNILDLNKKIQRNHDDLSAKLTSLQQQFFISSNIAESQNAMQEQIRKLLQSLYFDNIEILDFSKSSQGSISRLMVNTRFTGVPQQLPRLQAALAQSTTMLVIDDLEIKVVDDSQRGGKQLAVAARFVGLHMGPLPDYISASESKTTDARP